MGRDFSIGCSDSTCKGVSHIMFQMVKFASQIKDSVDIDDIPHEDTPMEEQEEWHSYIADKNGHPKRYPFWYRGRVYEIKE